MLLTIAIKIMYYCDIPKEKERIIMRTDFHSHILPCVDDGARSAEESVKMLEALRDSGVDRVVLTPHFYRQKEDIGSFLSRRQASFEMLQSALPDSSVPELVLGAEVFFYPSLAEDPELGRLRIEGTGYILLELPFERFFDNFYAQFMTFVNRCGCRVMLAHAERYLSFGNTVRGIERLCSLGSAVCQMNCDSLANAGFFDRRRLLRMIDSGLIGVMGTDAHNTHSRPPRFAEAERIIRKKCGDDAFERLCGVGDDIFSG